MIIVFCIIIAIICYTCNSYYIPSSFNRAIYSVVIHNDTNETLNDITILYGKDNAEPNTVVEGGRMDHLKPNEYRKVNILTSSPSEKAIAPYNVWVEIFHNGLKQNHIAGYFGKNTGGLAYFELSIKDNELIAQRIYQHEKEYKKIFQRNKKKQLELSW